MRYLIITPTYPMQPKWYYELPFGLGYISAVLKRAGYEGEFINSNEIPQDELDKRFAESVKRADVVLTGGLSVEFSDIRTVVRVAKEIKPSIVTIIGGGLVTAEPELVMHATKADIGGEG